MCNYCKYTQSQEENMIKHIRNNDNARHPFGCNEPVSKDRVDTEFRKVVQINEKCIAYSLETAKKGIG